MKRLSLLFLLSIFAIGLVAAYGEKKAPSAREKSTKTKMLETETALLQSKAPLNTMNVYMDGFHFYNGDMKRQIEAHHYCNQVNEDFIQCVLFNSNKPDARLIGVEYVISDKLFKGLPEEEKKLWHSHAYEVKSGLLTAPGISKKAEHEFMKKAASTYGKTWHFWHLDQPNNALPLGIPMLMMGFTADGQIIPTLVADRDKRFGISTEAKKKSRADLPTPSVQAGADAWQVGQIVQLRLSAVADTERRGSTAPSEKRETQVKRSPTAPK